MSTLLFLLVILGVLIWAIRLKIPESKKSSADLAKEELREAQKQSHILDICDETVDEQITNADKQTKLNQKREKLDERK